MSKGYIFYLVVGMLSQIAFAHASNDSSQNGEIKCENTAIILIEFQKNWTEKGFFHDLIKEEYESRNVLGNAINLVNTARKFEFPVIQAPLILDETDTERYKKIPSITKQLRGFTKGTWKEEFTEGIYEKADSVVKGRCGFDATECSNLEEILKQKAIKNIFFCGFTTDHCVEYTMKTLISKGYNCILVSDCTATGNNKSQKEVEKRNKTITSSNLIKLFEAGKKNN